MFSGQPTPEETLKITHEDLRAIGFSNMKVKYVHHISEVFAQKQSKLTDVLFYRNSTSKDLIKELVKLKGVGEWSAKMFSIFTLKEIDIFAEDDLGVARGVARYLQNRPELFQTVKNGVHAVEELKAKLKKKGKFDKPTTKRDWTPVHDEYMKFLGLMYTPYQLVFMLIMWRLALTNIDVLENVGTVSAT